MASAALGEELSCSICLNLYKEPVSLKCGHNFCQDCIVIALDTQETSGVYSCPECREEHTERPVLERNRKLCNIVENFKCAQQEKSEIFCTYCLDSPAAAVKSCLQCETSMCDKHLAAHNKTVDHVLMEPASCFSSKKCSIHKKLLEYYCSDDSTCLCVSCFLVGKHKGHEVELLEEASEKKKEKLRNIQENLNTERSSNQTKILNLQEQKRKAHEKAEEKRVLAEISRMEEQVSVSVSSLIKHLKVQVDELSKKIVHVEKICNMSDPITVLQDQESDTGKVPQDPKLDTNKFLQDQQSDRGDQNVEKSSVCDLDDFQMSLVLHRSITDLNTNLQLKNNFFVQDGTDLLLDVKTAHNFVSISRDLKTASHSKTSHIRPNLPGRFTTYIQVMSVQSFSCGRHYWEVEVSNGGDWDVGVSYPSIERKTDKSAIGYNTKSWSFRLYENRYEFVLDNKTKVLSLEPSIQRLGIYLDYDGGRLSYYQVGHPIKQLHTFTAIFTEPLHAAFYVDNGAWVKITSTAIPKK
uniref:Uncharacterized protein n=1 Tax=Pyxicephalus adspersus TaxID=30357 RepID=A0AAV2ZXV6_PYXAD|nr:TPA: hypothetical protein GDO54_014966 [Pyxicephalus adspersus]